jgi:hypothetical protein
MWRQFMIRQTYALVLCIAMASTSAFAQSNNSLAGRVPEGLTSE